MKRSFGFSVTGHNLGTVAVWLKNAPSRISREIHFDLVGKVGRRVVPVMRNEIRLQFPPSRARQTRANGQPRRWQTPTGALANSIGLKKIPRSQMRRGGQLAIAFVGARTDFRATKSVKQRITKLQNLGLKSAPSRVFIPKGTKGNTISPSRYIHLALKGHRKGRGPVAAKAYDFMTPTLVKAQQEMDRVIASEHEPAFDKLMARDFDKTVAKSRRRQKYA